MTNDKPEPIKPTGRRYRSGTRRLTRLTKQLAATAHHEAGHAVADSKLGFKIKQVTIVPCDESRGTATSTGLRVLRLLRRLEYGSERTTGKLIGDCHDLVITLFAGEEAQRRFDPLSIRRHMSAGDYQSAKEVLMRLHQDAERECFYAFKYLRARARNFISDPKNWRLIEDLAKALLERRTLTGEEVNDVIQASRDAQIKEWQARKK
jgi:ATP-dependent Zn protease